MAILNYTTTVEALKTVGEIQGILVAHGAKSIYMDYNEGVVVALAFVIDTPFGEVPIRLPVNARAVLAVMEKQNRQSRIPRRFVNYPQAVRVAWRITKDWVEAQVAILETEMVTLEQIFLPYIETKGGKTLYEVMVERHLALPEGKEQEV